MFEQAFRNIDDVLRKEAGCTTELDYTEQTSWLLFLKYLDSLEQDKADEAKLEGKKYSFILDKPYRWESWAAPKGKDGKLDHNAATTGDDLRDFVNQKLFPYLHAFKQKASGPNTIEYKIGEIFGEIKNKILSGYNMREIIDHIDELRFRSQTEKHELSHLYEAKIRNMGNAGRNGGEYYTPRPLIRAIVQVVKPKIGERIYDGAVGSAGFLCESFEYLKAKKGLTTKDLTTLQTRTFYGKEKKSLAYVIAIMNMILHGIEAPNIIHTNTLTENLADIQEKDRYDIFLAKRYTETDFNKIIEIKEREAHRVRLFMDQINQQEKTLVFCATQDGEPIDNTTAPSASTGTEPDIPKAKEPEGEYTTRKTKVRIKLADGKARSIQHMMMTTFWHPDGTPMSAQQFMEMLFGKLPEFFKDEAELRALWSAPDTRAKLLQGLAEKGFGRDQLAEMQKIIDAEKSDLFDVLAHVAYALPTLTREERAQKAKIIISTRFNSKQQVFLDFVLSQYVKVGVDELAQEKLSPLLKLKYNNAIADAVADLGRPEEIGKTFAGFQKYLYQQQAAA
jgi:hypothetical protein